MNKVLIDNINKYVKPDDILIHVGDWSMGGRENVVKFRESINCLTIYLILGNHDRVIKKNRYALENNARIQTLFAGTYSNLEIQIDDITIILSHYPKKTWNYADEGSWMLHGHSHNNIHTDKPLNHWYKSKKILDIGVDTAYHLFNEYRPFNFLEIKEIMDKRNI